MLHLQTILCTSTYTKVTSLWILEHLDEFILSIQYKAEHKYNKRSFIKSHKQPTPFWGTLCSLLHYYKCYLMHSHQSSHIYFWKGNIPAYIFQLYVFSSQALHAKLSVKYCLVKACIGENFCIKMFRIF